MKIAVILSIGLPVPAVYGGAIEQLITILIDENEKYGVHQIYVNSPYKQGMEKEAESYAFTQIHYRKCLFDAGSLEKAKKETGIEDDKLTGIFLWLKELQPDVIVMEEGDFKSCLPFARYFGRERMVLHLHHDYYPCKSVEDSFGTVITVSEYAKNTYLDAATNEKTDVEVVRNCATENFFRERITRGDFVSLRRELGFTEQDFIVIFCGRILLEKGVLEIVKAIKNVECDNVKLLVVGSVNFKTNDTTDYCERVLREIRESEGKVRYIGYVDNWELYKFYQIADVQVVPSLWEEVAGIVAIEGMMCGLPLIVTDSGGLIEYVDEQCACIVKRDRYMRENLKNSIIELYENREKRYGMEAASLNRARLYSREYYYKDFIKVCEHAVVK